MEATTAAILPSSILGNQIITEGLLSDILSEHFGESVELIGVILLRNGPLTFTDLVRIANANFLAFPRDTLNTFNSYPAASIGTETISVKTVRDALLVLIHYQLVDAEAGVYTLRVYEVYRRLCFPLYCSAVAGEERQFLQLVLMRGRIRKSDIPKSDMHIVDSLLARRFLVTVDTVEVAKSTSPRKSSPKKLSPKKADRSGEQIPDEEGTGGKLANGVVITYNTCQLELEFMKKFMLEFLADRLRGSAIGILECLLNVCSVGSSASVSLIQSLSIGDLSVTDLQKLLPKIPKQELIGMIIELQGLGYIGRKKTVQSVGSSVSKKRKTGKQQQVVSPEDDDDDFNRSLTGGAVPSYVVKFFTILEEIQEDMMSEIVIAKYGQEGGRVYQLLVTSNQKMESAHIADICAISREDSMKYLHAFSGDSICCVQEVPKVFSSIGAGGGGTAGVSAMMRAVASAFWLYFIDKDRARRALVTIVCQSIVNLRRRFRLEVTRQCKIEDRASVLTAVEEAYLERVHAAQDTLEANAVNLVPSLVFLLCRSN
jgi:hypothetical protein